MSAERPNASKPTKVSARTTAAATTKSASIRRAGYYPLPPRARGRKWLAEHPEVTKENDEDRWWFGFWDAAVTVVPTDDATLKRLAFTDDDIWEAKLDQPGENVRDTVRLAIEQAIEVHAQKQLEGARS